MTNEIFKKEKLLDKVLFIIQQADFDLSELHDEAKNKGWDDLTETLDEYSSRLEDIRDHLMSHEVVEAAGDMREDQANV